MKKIWLAIFLFLLIACSLGQAAIPPETGIAGQIWIGPMCPAMQVGEVCPDQPYQATLTVNTLPGAGKPNGTRVTQFESDEEGYFHIPLSPGEYILHPESPNGIPFAEDQTFIVLEGEYTPIIVLYDSGIR